MKRFRWDKLSVKFNSRLSTSILLLVMMIFSLAGATQAWFTTGGNISQNVFTAGTISLSEPVMAEITSMSARSLVPEDLNGGEPGDDGLEGNSGEEDSEGEDAGGEDPGEDNSGGEDTDSSDGENTGEEEPGTGDSGEEGSNDEGAGKETPGEDGTGDNGTGDDQANEEGTGDENPDGNEGSGDDEGSGSDGEEPGESNTGSDGDQVLNTEVKMATVAPSCKELSWNFTSTGSKRSYVRVKPSASAAVDCHIYIAVHLEVGGETAWVGVPGGGPSFPGGQAWNQYFVYPLGVYTESNPLKLDILSGANYTDTGDAYFWDDGNKLYFHFETVDKEMRTIHIYAGEEPPINHSPGLLGWEFTVNGYYFNYDTVVIFPCQGASASVYLSTLYGGAVPVTISLCQHSMDTWVPGADGWYYYGTAGSGPTEVYPGDNVGVCFTYCVTHGDVEDISVSLEAEAVQWSNGAIDFVWGGGNPWN